MDVVRRRVNGVMKEYYIYTQEEADKLGIKYGYWKDVKEPGWVLTDDGYVGELLRVRTWGKLTEYAYSFAKLPANATKLNWEIRKKNKSYHTFSERGHMEGESRKTRTKNLAKIYARMLWSGEVDWERLGKIYRPEVPFRVKLVKKYLKNKYVRELVDKELSLILQKGGITDEWLIEKYKKAIELAEKKGNPAALQSVIDKLASYKGWDNKTKVKATNEFDYRAKELGMEGTVKITASKEINSLPPKLSEDDN